MFFNTLSGRFLGLTIIFVMLAEVLIFVPSVAGFRREYLQNKIELSQLAALALLATPDDAVAPDLEKELLTTVDALNVVVRREGVRELVLASPMPTPIDASYDILDSSDFTLMRDALRVFVTPGDPIIRIIGRAHEGEMSEIEVTLHQKPLREAMIKFAVNVLWLSLIISISTAALLFFAVRRFIVRPINGVIKNMSAYSDNPEDASRVIAPRSDIRELRRAETALHDLQVQLTGSLKQKDRLAALGGAVAKISHDLRNLLTTAQLLADRIDMSTDPGVSRTAPKLVNSLSRAIALCERTLTYGKAEEPPPELEVVDLAPLIAEVIENETQAVPAGTVAIESGISEDMQVRVDADQFFRVISNLVRNAAQAIEASGVPGSISITAAGAAGQTSIFVSDTGPGLPPKARENLFQPFRGGVRQGGTGLGLVIAEEIIKGHGGTLTLSKSDAEGTTFEIALPAFSD